MVSTFIRHWFEEVCSICCVVFVWILRSSRCCLLTTLWESGDYVMASYIHILNYAFNLRPPHAWTCCDHQESNVTNLKHIIIRTDKRSLQLHQYIMVYPIGLPAYSLSRDDCWSEPQTWVMWADVNQMLINVKKADANQMLITCYVCETYY